MAQDAESTTVFRAGDLVLDGHTHQVSVAGRQVDLPSLSYRLLEVLMQRAPSVVGTDELIEQVWQGRIVSLETITQRVKLLRQAIRDDAKEPKYVGVVSGQGYHMLAPVQRSVPDEPLFATSLLAELNRRRVVQVALLYAAVAWSITEILSFLLEALPVFPTWSKSLVAIMFVVGFPLAMFLSWCFDIAPGGIRRTEASTTRGRLTIAVSVFLMVGATAGLFYLIYPSVSEQAIAPGAWQYTHVEFREDAIAVLPFQLLSSDPDDTYMSEGVASELRAQLGRTGGIHIVAETSSTAFRDQNVLAQEISSRLGAGRLIEGSLMRQGNSVRISVQIIDGISGLQTWSRPYDGTLARLMDMQQSIAEDVAQHLLGGAVEQIADPLTREASAFDLLLRARALEREVYDEQVVDVQKQNRVIDLYRQATEADPTSALAFSRLAKAYLYLGDVIAAEAPLFRALTLDPELSEVQNTLGHYYSLTQKELAGEAYREAVLLDPNNADALGAYGFWLLQQGKGDAGVYYRRALNLDPQSLERYRALGAYYGATGQRELALMLAQDIQLRFDDVRSFGVLARIYEQTGDVDVAIAFATRAVRRDPGNRELTWQLAALYSRIGYPEAANLLQPEPILAQLFWQRRYDELIEDAELAMIDYPSDLPIRYLLGFAYSVNGQYDRSIDVLESAGLPESAISSSRSMAAVEALVTLANAYQEAGRVEAASDALEFTIPFIQSGKDSVAPEHYWAYLYGACALSIAGRPNEALEYIRGIPRTSELVWEPVLKDAPCFKPFENHPDYLAVLEDLEDRKRVLRERLPETLESYLDLPE